VWGGEGVGCEKKNMYGCWREGWIYVHEMGWGGGGEVGGYMYMKWGRLLSTQKYSLVKVAGDDDKRGEHQRYQHSG
jgi:hypothetical protein